MMIFDADAFNELLGIAHLAEARRKLEALQAAEARFDAKLDAFAKYFVVSDDEDDHDDVDVAWWDE